MQTATVTEEGQDYNKFDRSSIKFTSNATNIILNDLKNLSTTLKQISQNLYEANNSLINKLLTMQDSSLVKFIEELLFHILMVGQILSHQKSFPVHTIVNLVAKIITIANFLVQQGFITPNNIQQKEQTMCQRSKDIQQQQFNQNGNLSKQQSVIREIKGLEQITSHKKSNLSDNCLSDTLFRIIDILSLLKASKSEGLELRIIQTAFSMVNRSFLKFMSHDYIIKLYQICFECCLNSFKALSKDSKVIAEKAMVQNISISAISALTETVFSLSFNHQHSLNFKSGNRNPALLTILQCFLQFLLRDKKFQWLNDNSLKGVVWDLIIIAIRNLEDHALVDLCEKQGKFKSVKQMLLIMYNISADSLNNQRIRSQQDSQSSIFEKSITMIDQNSKKSLNAKQKSAISNNLKKGGISDFVRFYKAFIYFTIHLWGRPIQKSLCPIVYFDIFLNKLGFEKMYESQENRSIKLFLLLQGIYLLLVSKPDLPLTEEKGYSLLAIMSRISQQICLSHSRSQNPNQILDVKWWDIQQIFLDKMCGQFNDVTDGDFVRLILIRQYIDPIENKVPNYGISFNIHNPQLNLSNKQQRKSLFCRLKYASRTKYQKRFIVFSRNPHNIIEIYFNDYKQYI